MGKNDLEELQKEFKVLKNEIKGSLLDVREYLLTRVENPFPVEMATGKVPAGSANRESDKSKTQPEANKENKDQDDIAKRDRRPIESGNDSSGARSFSGNPAPAGEADLPKSGAVFSDRRLFEDVKGILAAQSINASPAGSIGEAGFSLPKQGIAQSDLRFFDEVKESPGGNGKTGLLKQAGLPSDKRPVEEKKEAPAAAKTISGSPTGGNGKTEPKVSSLLKREAPAMPVKDSPEALPERAGVDLVTVVMLATWVENSVSKVGSDKLNAIVDIYTSVGRIGPEVREVLLKLAGLSGNYDAGVNVSMRDCMQVFMDLDNVILRNSDKIMATALFPLFNK